MFDSEDKVYLCLHTKHWQLHSDEDVKYAFQKQKDGYYDRFLPEIYSRNILQIATVNRLILENPRHVLTLGKN